MKMEHLTLNPNSLTVLKDCYVEPNIADVKPEDKFQFVRQGYFCADLKIIQKRNLYLTELFHLKVHLSYLNKKLGQNQSKL